MPMYSLMEFSNNCCKTFGSLYQFYRYDSALDNNVNIADLVDNNTTTDLFRFKEKSNRSNR